MQVTVSRHPIFQRQDVHIFSTVPISFAQAALGGTIKIDTVDGPYEYTLKPGTQTDTTIRLKGKGIQAMGKAGVYGDLYVTVQVQVPRNLSEESKRKLREFDTSTRVAGTRNSRTA